MRMPAWELMHRLKHQTVVQSLKDIHDDSILMDLAFPVLNLIEKTYLSADIHRERTEDPILQSWKNSNYKRFNNTLKIKLETMKAKAGVGEASKMASLDDKIAAIMTHEIQASWYRVDKQMFEDGPYIVIFPKEIEEGVRYDTVVDSLKFDETPHRPNEDFHVVNSESLSPIAEEEEMEVIEIVAVTD